MVGAGRRRREKKQKREKSYGKNIRDFISIPVDGLLLDFHPHPSRWVSASKATRQHSTDCNCSNPTFYLFYLVTHTPTEKFLRLNRLHDYVWGQNTALAVFKQKEEERDKPSFWNYSFWKLKKKIQKKRWQSFKLGRLFRTAAVQLISALQPVTNSLISERRRKNLLGWVPGDSGQKEVIQVLF